MIPPKTVRDILDAVRIEEVVEEFVALRKRGVNLIGLCPFHHEKTPSFNVNPTRNIFKCFGCGKGGDAVTFLMEHESFTYPDALRWLARKYNIEIEEMERSPEQIAEQQLADSLYIVNDFALRHFQEQLFDTDEGKSVALAYFKQRGLREETIRTFGLGYAPDLRDLLLQRAKAAGHNIDLIKKVGLSSADGSRDFFRGRVMFAIHNLSGKVAAFAGRTMSSDKNIPKYINSPETEIYVKNKTLYGAFQAKKAIRQQDECILVEGYMDVISLHQAGIENVVASSGTSLTEGQLQLIKRNTANLKILYDGDPAGIKAALRGLDLALEQDLNVKIVLLPNGEDPDSFVQKIGSEEFGGYIVKEAKDFILFYAELLNDEIKGDPIKKWEKVREIIELIAKIEDDAKRQTYIRQCVQTLKIPEDAIQNEVKKVFEKQQRKKFEKLKNQPRSVSDLSSEEIKPDDAAILKDDLFKGRQFVTLSDEFQERDVIRLLIQFGGQVLPGENITVAEYMLADIEESLGNFDNPLYGKIARECHSLLLEGKSVTQDYFLHHESKEVSDLAVDLLSSPWEYSPNWEEKWNYPLQNQPMPELNFNVDTRYALDRFKLRKLLKMCDVNLLRIKSASDSGDVDNMIRFLKIQQKLNETRNELAKRVGTVVLK